MIRFSKYIWLYFLISALVLVPGIFSLIRWGFVPSIDFTGGTFIEIAYPTDVPLEKIEESARSTGVDVVNIQKSDQFTYSLRLKPSTPEVIQTFEKSLTSHSETSPQILRNESVGPVLGAELLQKAILAAIIAITGILAYIAYAFKNIRFGVSAIIALFHDLIVVLGSFSLLGHFMNIEVDTLFVTAFLTTMSFSVHDTIVVFDRIREYVKKNPRGSFDEISDLALTETMGRSLTNSFTIIFMLLALILLGGATIQWFVVALLIGTVSGTYSSPFIATPILVMWNRWENKKKLF